jgi:hypothetical protein
MPRLLEGERSGYYSTLLVAAGLVGIFVVRFAAGGTSNVLRILVGGLG